jgi:hypothetical protein
MRERERDSDNKNKKIDIFKKILVPKKITDFQIKKFFINKNLNELINLSKLRDLKVNEMIINSPYKPGLNDLYRLYQFIFLNKRTTVLEFGSGYSSLIFSLALNDLNKLYKNKLINLRRNNPFELFILENEKKFLNITKKRIKKFSKKLNLNTKVNYHFSDIEMSLYENKISTSYKKLPLCNPDFIYLDGPDQFNIKRDINNFSTRHKDMMPMVNDILKIEYFLTPGTIIVTDGRGANAQFLRDYLKRNWLYKFDYINDQHIFYLNEKPLGKYNKLQLEFYKN